MFQATQQFEHTLFLKDINDETIEELTRRLNSAIDIQNLFESFSLFAQHNPRVAATNNVIQDPDRLESDTDDDSELYSESPVTIQQGSKRKRNDDHVQDEEDQETREFKKR